MQTNWTTTVQYYQLSSAQVSRLSHAFSTKNSWLVSRVRQGLNYQEVTNIQPFLVEFPAKFLQIPEVCLKIAPTCNNFCYNDFFPGFTEIRCRCLYTDPFTLNFAITDVHCVSIYFVKCQSPTLAITLHYYCWTIYVKNFSTHPR